MTRKPDRQAPVADDGAPPTSTALRRAPEAKTLSAPERKALERQKRGAGRCRD